MLDESFDLIHCHMPMTGVITRIAAQVVFAGYRSDIEQILAASDLFLFPSLREGLSVAVMEAMRAGLPVVAKQIRGNVDLIENRKGGIPARIQTGADPAAVRRSTARSPPGMQALLSGFFHFSF